MTRRNKRGKGQRKWIGYRKTRGREAKQREREI